jgi:acyl-CoA thioester hydrolase
MAEVFSLTQRVDTTHIDGLGHVNNVVYLQWIEQLAWRHSEALGLGLTAYRAFDTAMVARQHTLTYLAACFLGDVLCLETWLGERNALHVFRHYRFVRQSDGVVVFEGQTDWVCVRLSTGRPQRMPLVFKTSYGVV